MEVFKCPNCGSSILTNDKFCSFCGKGISEKYKKHPTNKMTDDELSKLIVKEINKDLRSPYHIYMSFFILGALHLYLWWGIASFSIIYFIIACIFVFILVLAICQANLFSPKELKIAKKLARQKKFDEILELKKSESTIDYQILILFYHKKDVNQAKHLLLKYRMDILKGYIKKVTYPNCSETLYSGVLLELIRYYYKNGDFEAIESKVKAQQKIDLTCACCGASLPTISSVCEYCGSIHYPQNPVYIQKPKKQQESTNLQDETNQLKLTELHKTKKKSKKTLPKLSQKELIEVINSSTEILSFNEFDARTHVFYYTFMILVILFAGFLVILPGFFKFGSLFLSMCMLLLIVKDMRILSLEKKYKQLVSNGEFNKAFIYAKSKNELKGFQVLLLFYYYYDFENCLIILKKYAPSSFANSPAKQKQFKAIYDYFDIKKEKRK